MLLMFGDTTIIWMCGLLVVVSIGTTLLLHRTYLLRMNLLDPDFCNGSASNLLHRFESIAEPLLLSFCVVDLDLDLTLASIQLSCFHFAV